MRGVASSLTLHKSPEFVVHIVNCVKVSYQTKSACVAALTCSI